MVLVDDARRRPRHAGERAAIREERLDGPAASATPAAWDGRRRVVLRRRGRRRRRRLRTRARSSGPARRAAERSARSTSNFKLAAALPASSRRPTSTQRLYPDPARVRRRRDRPAPVRLPGLRRAPVAGVLPPRRRAVARLPDRRRERSGAYALSGAGTASASTSAARSPTAPSSVPTEPCAPARSRRGPTDRARSFFEAIEEAAAKLRAVARRAAAQAERARARDDDRHERADHAQRRAGSVCSRQRATATRSPIMKGAGRLAGLSADRLLDLPHTDKPEQLVARADRRRGRRAHRLRGRGHRSARRAVGRRGARAARRRRASTRSPSACSGRSGNDAHEQRVVELARERHPELFVTAASEVSAQVGEYERTMTGVINSYIGPLMSAYVEEIETGARERGYSGRIMYAQCAGGTITADEAQRGPDPDRALRARSCGTLGSAFLAERMGEPNVIVTDMGGTSFDVSVIRDGAPGPARALGARALRDRPADGLRRVDRCRRRQHRLARRLRRAPGRPAVGRRRSGPGLLRKGGTRADRHRRRRRARHRRPRQLPARRAVKLDRAAPRRRSAGSPSGSGSSVHETAAGINRIVDSKMADLLRRMSVLRGLDPREFVCFAYGGMGPGARGGGRARGRGEAARHAAAARRPGLVGVRRDRRRRRPRLPASAAAAHARRPGGARAPSRDARAAGSRASLRSEGFGEDASELRRSLRMKYSAQVFDVEVPLPARRAVRRRRGSPATSRMSTRRCTARAPAIRRAASRSRAFIVRARGCAEPPLLAPPPSGDCDAALAAGLLVRARRVRGDTGAATAARDVSTESSRDRC